jgi:hypothetical protein
MIKFSPHRTLVMLVFLFVGALPIHERNVRAEALQNRWGFGSDLGFIAGTTNGTVFALGFNADYYVDRAFSVGPMVLLAPAGDLTQVMIAGVARYHFRSGQFNIVPFAGLGFAHASLDKVSGPTRIEGSDTSYYIPIGVSAEYQLSPKLALANTIIVNLHDIDIGPPVPQDRTSVALMFGIRFGP